VHRFQEAACAANIYFGEPCVPIMARHLEMKLTRGQMINDVVWAKSEFAEITRFTDIAFDEIDAVVGCSGIGMIEDDDSFASLGESGGQILSSEARSPGDNMSHRQAARTTSRTPTQIIAIPRSLAGGIVSPRIRKLSAVTMTYPTAIIG
jgi:hypothetical protein